MQGAESYVLAGFVLCSPVPCALGGAGSSRGRNTERDRWVLTCRSWGSWELCRLWGHFGFHFTQHGDKSQHTGGHPASLFPVSQCSDGNKMDGKWEKQAVKSMSSKQAQARQRTPKGWVTAGKGLQEPAKAFMFREVRHLLLPLSHNQQ